MEEIVNYLDEVAGLTASAYLAGKVVLENRTSAEYRRKSYSELENIRRQLDDERPEGAKGIGWSLLNPSKETRRRKAFRELSNEPYKRRWGETDRNRRIERTIDF